MEQGHASSSTPSVSSSSVGMVSSKCVESVSKGSDFDCIIVTQEDNSVAKNDQGQEKPAKRKKPLKSEVWNHFDRIKIDTKGKQVSGEDSRAKLGVHKFDPDVERALYAKMTAKHDLPFLMAEYEYFRLWISSVIPSYKFRSKNTVKSDLLGVYAAEKDRIYKEIENLTSRVSFTTDGWKPKHQNRSYFCVTCHYIDDDWVLHKRVISFRVVPYPHGGVNLSAWLKERILEWNIDNKLSSIVVDNASNNIGMLLAIERLKELDPEFKFLPSELEWENGKKVCDRLKIF
ncbi:hypothetical protein AgCh_027788 [Apium graveolens]